MRHELCFYHEEGPIEPAADSLRERLVENHNLPGVYPLSLPRIKGAFSRYFPDIIVSHSGMEWEAADGSFQVSFSFDDCSQPTSICVSSQNALVDTPQIFDRIIAAAREVGCTRIESAIK